MMSEVDFVSLREHFAEKVGSRFEKNRARVAQLEEAIGGLDAGHGAAGTAQLEEEVDELYSDFVAVFGVAPRLVREIEEHRLAAKEAEEAGDFTSARRHVGDALALDAALEDRRARGLDVVESTEIAAEIDRKEAEIERLREGEGRRRRDHGLESVDRQEAEIRRLRGEQRELRAALAKAEFHVAN